MRTYAAGSIAACAAPLAIGLAIVFSLAFAKQATAVDDPRVPPPARQRELLTLLRNDCGACHGMRLTGGLGPPLTPEALRERPVDTLEAVVIKGRPGTAMPPWEPFMSQAEAAWLIARLREGETRAR
jgi:cytochrome c55X